MRQHRLISWTAAVLVASALNLAAFTGGPIRCGKITNFRLVDAVTFTWNSDDYGDQPYLADGEKFAIVSVNLSKDRTVGKYDYTLGGQKCLAMAQQQDPFDPDKWEYTDSGAATEVHMLYKVKEDAAPFSFAFELTSREPILKVTTTGVTGFGDGPDPNAFASARAAATGGDASAATADEGADGADEATTEDGDAAAETAEPAPAEEDKNDAAADILGEEAKKQPDPKAKKGNDILDDW